MIIHTILLLYHGTTTVLFIVDYSCCNKGNQISCNGLWIGH